MKRLEFICDGCDYVDHVALETVNGSDYMLKGWVTHRIVAHENGTQTYEIIADLCPNCSENLRRAINPANWPRMRSTLNEPYRNEVPKRHAGSMEQGLGSDELASRRSDHSVNSSTGASSVLRETRNVRLQSR